MVDVTDSTPPCPYCGKILPTSKAQQCFECGWDWHDHDNPVQRGDPNWNRFGLDPDVTYVVELCQESSGGRYTRYREVDGEPGPGTVLETEPAIGRRFIEWGFYVYADHLRLSTGERFAFDSHGIWLTESEIQAMIAQRRSEGGEPSWVNGIRPLFAPK